MQITAGQRICDLVDRLRPTDPLDPEGAVRAETLRLTGEPDQARAIAAALTELLRQPRQGALFAEAGVRSALGFWLELLHRLGRRLMPLPARDDHLDDVMRSAFCGAADAQWVAAVAEGDWAALAMALGLHPDSEATLRLLEALRLRLGEAILMLSHRLAGGSLDRELLRLLPELESLDSPFLAQNRLLQQHLDPSAGKLDCGGDDTLAALAHSLARCDEAVARARELAHEHGVTIRLSYLLSRLEQLAERLRVLAAVLGSSRTERKRETIVALLRCLVAATVTGRGVFVFVADDLRLLARNMTDHASRRGEHYIAENRRELLGIAAAAAGGGVLIALLALIKIRIALLHLPPLTEGFLFGLNYGLGFVLIHLLGCSVATKQPSMTAATIAAHLDGAPPGRAAGLAALVRDVLRSQSVAVAGNVALAFPIAGLIAAGWAAWFGESVAPAAKAGHLLDELNPFASGALVFAAIAGIGLFLSGLVSAYFDNQCRHGRFAERLPASPFLGWASPERARRIAGRIDTHYGAVMGNLFFGFFLGFVGETGNLIGLPVDVRHVAFSTANAGMAAMVVEPGQLRDAAPHVTAGLVAIGATNLVVSFWLALCVAMLSRGHGMRLRRAGDDLSCRPSHRSA